MDIAVERRMFERLNSNFSGRYSTKDTKECGELRGLNVSGAGVMVYADNKIPEEGVLEVWLSSSQTKEPIYAKGRVAWQREIASGKWQAGIKFYRPKFMELANLISPFSLWSSV